MRRSLHILILGVKIPPETFLLRLFFGLQDAGVKLSVASRQITSTKNKLPFSHVLKLYPNSPKGLAGSFFNLVLACKPFNKRGLISIYKTLKWKVNLNRQNFSSRYFISSQPSFSAALFAWVDSLRLALNIYMLKIDQLYFPWNSSATEYFYLINSGWPTTISCRGAQIHVSQTNPRRNNFNLQVLETLKNCTFIHCVSSALANKCLELGVEAKKIYTITPAIPLPLPLSQTPQDPKLTKWLAQNSGPLLVATGSLIWRKGYEFLLTAFKKLNHPNARLIIIGSGPDRDRILFTRQDLNLEESVYLAGQLSSPEIFFLLRKASIFTLPSISEGISNAALEALACSLPVISFDWPGCDEMIESGVHGILVPCFDIGKYSEAIHTLLLQPQIAKNMGQAGKMRVEKKFNLNDQVRKFYQLWNNEALHG